MGPWFLVMFFSLLAGKVWGWIGEGRVEILEQQPPRNPRLFHTRLALSLGLSVAFDLMMLEYIVSQVMRMAKPDMMVMFGFEFAVLSITSWSTAARYAINLVEIGIVREQKRSRGEAMRKERVQSARTELENAQRRESQPQDTAQDPAAMETVNTLSVEDARTALRRADQPVDENEVEVEGWEAKGRWVFYLDLATDFFKLVVYMSFFIILLVFYGLPIHIMRDVFLTARSFFKRISDFLKYRTATRDMNERYPDATADEIGREDVCIICREDMRPYQAPAPGQPPLNPAVERMRPKKLPCGHVLHFACLRSWLERQQVCPTCRRSVVPTPATGSAQPAAQANGQAGPHPPGERPGPRVYQFGPLRIGVGAARGNNMFEDLQQQLAEGRAAPAARGEQNANGPQQYGFGIRWEGRRRHHRRPREPQGTLREQLDSIAQQIRQETQALQDNTREYIYLREMQAELDRLRASRSQAATQAPVPGVPPPTGLGLPPVRSTQVLHAAPEEQTIPAGSDQLPAGLTLPEGWTMMPLRPAAGAPLPAQPTFPQFAPRPPGAQDGGVPAPPAGQPINSAAIPEHIRAMFNLPGQPATNGHPASTVQQQPAPGASTSTATGPESRVPGSSASTTSIGTGVAEPSTQPSGNTCSSASDPQAINGAMSHSLPSWGSPHANSNNGNGDGRLGDRVNGPSPDISGTTDASPSASRSKQASVEDTVEDPD
jgi:E3 ubiquitin-protein ligase synoviolin